jgi:hypothetical protein
MVEISREEYDRLRAAAERARAGSEASLRMDTPSLRTAGLAAPLMSAMDAKTLERVSKLPPPEGRVWFEGGEEGRSMKRFLNSVTEIARVGGLDVRGVFYYLTTRALDARLGLEVSGYCPALRGTPPDYGEVLEQSERYLNERFARTNRSDRYVERLESGAWCSGVKSLHEYRQSFHFTLAEASLLGVYLDPQQQLRHYLHSMPEQLIQKAKDILFLVPDLSIITLTDRLEAWMENNKINPFLKGKAGVRAVEAESNTTTSNTTPDAML